MYQDGFQIEIVWDDEEPLFVSREEEVVMPDYSKARAKCCICGTSDFQDIHHTVLHVKENHGVLGGSQILMLGEWIVAAIIIFIFNSPLTAADRMIKSGYISLTG